MLAATLEGADAKTLRDTMDKLKDKLKTAAIVLAAVDNGKVQIAAGVTADSTGKGQGWRAGQLCGPTSGRQGRRQNPTWPWLVVPMRQLCLRHWPASSLGDRAGLNPLFDHPTCIKRAPQGPFSLGSFVQPDVAA